MLVNRHALPHKAGMLPSSIPRFNLQARRIFTLQPARGMKQEHLYEAEGVATRGEPKIANLALEVLVCNTPMESFPPSVL